MSLCNHCNTNLETEKEIKCDLCGLYYHVKCTKLTWGETALLKSKERNLSYLCNKCKIVTKFDLINEINVLKQTVSELQEQVKELKEIKNNKSISTVQHLSSNPITDQNDVINELIERENRANNLVLFNIDDPICDNENEKTEDDIRKVHSVLSLLNVKIDTGLKIRRLGKIIENKRRPIKITLPSKEDALNAVKQRKKLKNLEDKVFVSLDLTPTQRDYYKKVKEELTERCNNGDVDLYIKYINYIPVIAKKVKIN